MHEAYFADELNDLPANTGHSSLVRAAEVAAAANVRRLVIVHIDPQIEDDSVFDVSAARQVFADTTIGVDGMELQF